MGLETLYDECSNEELILVIRILDEIMELDEHLLEANPHLNYAPFKFNNRTYRALAHSYLRMSYDEALQYNYPNFKKKRERE